MRTLLVTVAKASQLSTRLPPGQVPQHERTPGDQPAHQGRSIRCEGPRGHIASYPMPVGRNGRRRVDYLTCVAVDLLPTQFNAHIGVVSVWGGAVSGHPYPLDPTGGGRCHTVDPPQGRAISESHTREPRGAEHCRTRRAGQQYSRAPGFLLPSPQECARVHVVRLHPARGCMEENCVTFQEDRRSIRPTLALDPLRPTHLQRVPSETHDVVATASAERHEITRRGDGERRELQASTARSAHRSSLARTRHDRGSDCHRHQLAPQQDAAGLGSQAHRPEHLSGARVIPAERGLRTGMGHDEQILVCGDCLDRSQCRTRPLPFLPT